MGSNHFFRNPQGPCIPIPKEITQRGESGIGSNNNNDKGPKSGGEGDICYAFNNCSCSFNPYKFRHMFSNCSSPHTQDYCNSRQK